MAVRSFAGAMVYTIAVVLLDQITKSITKAYMVLGESIPVWGRFFRFTYVENSGIAFGINFNGGPVIFTIAASIATIGIIVYLWRIREGDLLQKISLALILGGAIGNLIDRFTYGRVVDFLHFSIGKHSWPVFNMADSFVTIGMVLFLYYSFFKAPQPDSISQEE